MSAIRQFVLTHVFAILDGTRVSSPSVVDVEGRSALRIVCGGLGQPAPAVVMVLVALAVPAGGAVVEPLLDLVEHACHPASRL